MNTKSLCIATCLLFLWSLPSDAQADYASELQDQIREIQARNAKEFRFDYFHDMGILARKADEAELKDLATQIVKRLFTKMDEYVQNEVKKNNDLYETDRYQASRRLQTLNQFRRFYEPTEDYLGTTGGQALRADMIKSRTDALEAFKKPCSTETITTGIQAILKTGLFITNTPEEIKSLAALNPKIECCLGFSPQLYFHNEQPFKSTYEEGNLILDAHLKLQTSRRDYSEAKWSGEWIRHFDGREGQGEAIAQATLQYVKGGETADLLITESRVTSVGRINFPMNLTGERRALEIKGKPLAPSALFTADKPVLLTGCGEKK